MDATTTDTPGLGALTADFLADPTPRTRDALWAAVRAQRGFRSDLVPGEELGEALSSGDLARVVAVGRSLMPGAYLSPSVHLALTHAYAGLGRRGDADREADLAVIGLRAVTATGDGSREAPWTVLRLSDEYDVLRHLGTASVSQAVLTVGGRTLDRHEGEDGSTYHFDVTGLA